jgi:hypothetical protein
MWSKRLPNTEPKRGHGITLKTWITLKSSTLVVSRSGLGKYAEPTTPVIVGEKSLFHSKRLNERYGLCLRQPKKRRRYNPHTGLPIKLPEVLL